MTPIKIAALLAALVGIVEAASPLVPVAYHPLMASALPFLTLLAGTLAPQVKVGRKKTPDLPRPSGEHHGIDFSAVDGDK